MKIVADTNIPFIKDAYSQFGEVALLPGREIKNDKLKGADILLVRSVTKVNEELLNGTSVKFVATATIGEDHIDKAYLKKQNIGFASAPGSNADSVAEYIVAGLMEYSRKKNKKLNELKLGIIGVGNVGSRVFNRASALGIECLLNDPPKQRETNDKKYCTLDEVLKNSGIVTVHVPLTKEGTDPTYHLINNDFLLKMKNNSCLFNTSRGKVMDENAIRANRAKLEFLALDVWETEPIVNIETLDMTDIASPHIAGYSYDGKVKGAKMIYEAACDFFSLKKNWRFDNLDGKVKVDLSNSENIIFDAINTSYPIMRDDENLRKIKNVDEASRALYFDELRKKYPKRLEFYNYEIICGNKVNKDEIEILNKLGFNMIKA